MPKLLDKKSPIQGTSRSNREAESTDAPARADCFVVVRTGFCLPTANETLIPCRVVGTEVDHSVKPA